MTAPAFNVDNLTASYGTLVAVCGVSLAFAAGGRVGIFGHNGSGKSTLAEMPVRWREEPSPARSGSTIMPDRARPRAP